MFEPLLAACPSFVPEWEAFCAEWEGEKDGLPQYLALADLARHVIMHYQNGAPAVLTAVFEVVERWHVEGERYVREAATIGFLEGLQNIAEHRGIDPKVFEPFLLPESRKWWDRLNRFWSGDATALRDE